MKLQYRILQRVSDNSVGFDMDVINAIASAQRNNTRWAKEGETIDTVQKNEHSCKEKQCRLLELQFLASKLLCINSQVGSFWKLLLRHGHWGPHLLNSLHLHRSASTKLSPLMWQVISIQLLHIKAQQALNTVLYQPVAAAAAANCSVVIPQDAPLCNSPSSQRQKAP